MENIFAGGKFRAKSKFANIAKISSTRKIGVIQYTKVAFLSSRIHNLPSKVRLHNNHTARLHPGCNNNAIFSDIAIFTFPTVSVSLCGSCQSAALLCVELIIFRVQDFLSAYKVTCHILYYEYIVKW